MCCRQLYAHKGSILLNSGSNHSKPCRCFFFTCPLHGEDLVWYSCAAWYCSRQEPDGTETIIKQMAFHCTGPNFECTLLHVICFCCGVWKTAYKTPHGGSTAAVSGWMGRMTLWMRRLLACHKIQLEDHQQLLLVNTRGYCVPTIRACNISGQY